MIARSPSQPDELLRAWGTQGIPVEDPERANAREEVVVTAIARSIRVSFEGRHASRRARWIGALTLAAASAVAAGGVLKWQARQEAVAAAPGAVVAALAGPVVVSQGGDSQVVAPSSRRALHGGDQVETAANASAEIRTPKSVVSIGSGTRVGLPTRAGAEEHYRVAYGRVGLTVNKEVPAVRRVVLETPNADMVLRGTVVSVHVTPRATGSATEVSVARGSVSVLVAGVQVALLGPGDRWSSEPVPVAVAAPSAPEALAAVPEAAPELDKALSHRAPLRHGSRGKPGTLSEENRLFQDALDARNGGDEAHAADLFGKLTTRYPRSELSEEARVERFRSLKRTGRQARAVAEARRYLADFPHGFAREEARTLALDSDSAQ